MARAKLQRLTQPAVRKAQLRSPAQHRTVSASSHGRELERPLLRVRLNRGEPMSLIEALGLDITFVAGTGLGTWSNLCR